MYVFWELKPDLLDQIPSFAIHLASIYSIDMFSGLKFLTRPSSADIEFSIQLRELGFLASLAQLCGA